MLELEAIDSYYGKSHVLFDLSLEVPDGGFVSIIGRNGAGKTTTLRTIAGLLEPRSGSIRFNETDITGWTPHDVSQQGIAIIPEDRRVFPDLSVRENLHLGRLAHAGNADESRLEDVYEYFPRLEKYGDKPAGAMSGGEQQMLAIGRALVADPDLILVDEPSEGLMPSFVEKVAEILSTVNDDGVSVLLVEQDIKLALELSDYGYLIDDGRIADEGDSNQLREKPEIRESFLGL